jgi:NAD(P)-dependent dehydrogenase (short-subunit alcohol dehydrogenase family)
VAKMRPIQLGQSTILITGAASGIGLATARELHRRGANIVATDVTQDGLDLFVKEVGDDRVLTRTADVTDIAAMRDVVAGAVARFGSLDVVFANAGIAAEPPGTIATIDEAVFERVIEVDLLGVWRTVRAALPEIQQARGHVLMTSSIYSFINGVINAPYAMSKAGVDQFGRSLRVELARHGATAGVLYPGWIDTPITHVAFGKNAIVTELRKTGYPGPFGWSIPPERVAVKVAEGIEGRRARIIVPRRWIPASVLRGVINPVIDAMLEWRPKFQRLLGELETK